MAHPCLAFCPYLPVQKVIEFGDWALACRTTDSHTNVHEERQTANRADHRSRAVVHEFRRCAQHFSALESTICEWPDRDYRTPSTSEPFVPSRLHGGFDPYENGRSGELRQTSNVPRSLTAICSSWICAVAAAGLASASATEAASRSVALVDVADMLVSGSSAHGALVRRTQRMPSVRRRPVFVGQVTAMTPSDVGHPARMAPVTGQPSETGAIELQSTVWRFSKVTCRLRPRLGYSVGWALFKGASSPVVFRRGATIALFAEHTY
jgi:hypothetical protein